MCGVHKAQMPLSGHCMGTGKLVGITAQQMWHYPKRQPLPLVNFQTYKRSRNEDKYLSFVPTGPQIKKEYADDGQQQFTGLVAKQSQVGVEQSGVVLLAAVTRQRLVTWIYVFCICSDLQSV